MLRGEYFNEDYYARRNHPTSNQFIGRYHFVDQQGRQYMIATDTKKAERPLFKPRTTTKKKKECVLNTNRYVKLFVKLPNTRTFNWFKSRDTNREIVLYDKDDRNIMYRITLKSSDKADPHSATGSIFVTGLSRIQCNDLLNRSIL